MSDYDSLTGWGLFVLIAVNLIALLKVMAPKFWETYVSRSSRVYEDRRTDAEQAYFADRQDDITRWSNMIALQKELTESNRLLTKTILEDFRQSQSDILSAIREFTSVMRDVDKHWIVAARTTEAMQQQQRVLTGELTRLTDTINELRNLQRGVRYGGQNNEEN